MADNDPALMCRRSRARTGVDATHFYRFFTILLQPILAQRELQSICFSTGRRHRTGEQSVWKCISAWESTRRGVHAGVAVAMASSVVKRIPLIRFPPRMRISVTPSCAASAPASVSSVSGTELKSPRSTGIDAGSSRPIHSGVPSQN